MRKPIAVLAFSGVLLCATGAPAQAAKVTGTVVDAENGSALADVQVSLDLIPPGDTPVATTSTDAAGGFALPDVEPGSYKLSVWKAAYAKHTEKVVLAPGDVKNIKVFLIAYDLGTATGGKGTKGIDINFQVGCIYSQIMLEGATVVAKRYADKEGAKPLPALVAATAGDGIARFARVEPAFYRFTVSKPHWKTASHPKKGTVLIKGNTSAMVSLAPEKGTLSVEVRSYNYKANKPDWPLDGVTVEIDGVDPADLDSGMPVDQLPPTVTARATVTGDDGLVTFKELPHIPWRLKVTRLGYKPSIQVVGPEHVGGATVKVSLEYVPTIIKVNVKSVYSPDKKFIAGDTETALHKALKFVTLDMDGIDETSTAGIHSGQIPAWDATNKRMVATFQVVPGMYLLKNRPDVFNFTQYPTPTTAEVLFQLEYEPAVMNVEAEEGKTVWYDLFLEPVPVDVTVRLFGKEPIPDPQYRVFSTRCSAAAMAQDGIELVGNYLDADHKAVTVATNAEGVGFARLPPGAYGARIPSLKGYFGEGMTVTEPPGVQWSGWSYPDDPEPGKFDLHFETGKRYTLNLFVRKEVFTLWGEIYNYWKGVSWGGYGLYSRSESGGTQGLAYYHVLNGGKVMVNDLDVPVVKDAGMDPYYFAHSLPPDTYTLAAVHPDFTFAPFTTSSATFDITEWGPPGTPLKYKSKPSKTDPGFMDWNAHTSCNASYAFDTTAYAKEQFTFKYHVYRWDSVNEQYPATPTTYHCGLVKPSITGDKVFLAGRIGYCDWAQYAGYLPHGVNQVWSSFAVYGPCYKEAQDGTITSYFFTAEGEGDIERTLYCLGPSHSPDWQVREITGPVPYVNPEYPNPKFDLVVRAVNFDDKTADIPGVTVTINGQNYSPPLSVPGFGGSAVITKATHPSGKWTLNGTEEKVTDYVNLAVASTARMKRTLLLGGKVTDWWGEPVASFSMRVYDRFGNRLRDNSSNEYSSVSTDQDGAFEVAGLPYAPMYVEIEAKGYYPQRLRVAPDPAVSPLSGDPDATVDVSLKRLPQPVIASLELDRFGLFLPGVIKSGDSTFGLDPDNAAEGLTATWKVEVKEATLDGYKLTGFDDKTGAETSQQFDAVVDEVESVLVMDRRLFTGHAVNEPDDHAELLDRLPATPADFTYEDYRALLAGIAEAKYTVYHSKSAAPENPGATGEDRVFTGRFSLWHLPPGFFAPVAIVITKRGAVTFKEYEVPGGKTWLYGVRIPDWLAYLTSIIGWISNYKPSVGENDDYKPAIGKRVPKAKFLPLPDFDGAIDACTDQAQCGDNFGYLQYRYVFGVDWMEGIEAPSSGVLGWISRKIGLFTNIKIEFKVEGNSGKVSVATLKPESKKGTVKSNKLHIPQILSKIPYVKVNTKEVGYKADTATQLGGSLYIVPTELDSNPMKAIELFYKIRTFLKTTIEADITPLVSLLPLAGPVIKGLSNVVDMKVKAILELGAGGEISGKLRTGLPGAMSATDTQPEEWDLFSTPVDIIPSWALILYGAGGIGVTAADGAVGATAKFEAGGLKDKPEMPGVFFHFYDGFVWPIVKRIEGSLNFVLDLFVKVWIYEVGKSFKWDLYRFDVAFDTDPSFSLVPYAVTEVVTTPWGYGSAAWIDDGAVKVDHFYPAGSFDAAGAGAPGDGGARWEGAADSSMFVYTDVSRDTGLMQVAVADGYRTAMGIDPGPVVLAEGTGVVDVAAAENASGLRMVVWAEVGGFDLDDPRPPSVLKYAVGTAWDPVWSEPEVLAALPDTAHDLALEPAGDGFVLAYRSTDRGPLSRVQDVHAALWRGGAWTRPERLVEETALRDVAVAGCPAPGCEAATVVYQGIAGDTHAFAWDGERFAYEGAMHGACSGRLSLSMTGRARRVLVCGGSRGVAVLSDSTGEWEERTVVAVGPDPEAVASARLGDGLAAAVSEDGTCAGVKTVLLDAHGNAVSEPAPVAADMAGACTRLRLVPMDAWRATLFVHHRSHADGTSSVRQFAVDATASSPDHGLVRPRSASPAPR